MKQYKVVLFDLDGTLTDPGIGITNSVMYALDKLGLPVPERSMLYKFIGPPLADSFLEFYGLNAQQAKEAVTCYREYFKDWGLYENLVYGGIPELLTKLKEHGKTLAVATSKPEVFAVKILEHFGLSRFFTCIAGANMDGTRTNKSEVIEHALASCGITDRNAVVMVGDREHDIFGAQKSGVDSIGVLYGYGDREEFERAGATHIVETVDGLERFLLEEPIHSNEL